MTHQNQLQLHLHTGARVSTPLCGCCALETKSTRSQGCACASLLFLYLAMCRHSRARVPTLRVPRCPYVDTASPPQPRSSAAPPRPMRAGVRPYAHPTSALRPPRSASAAVATEGLQPPGLRPRPPLGARPAPPAGLSVTGPTRPRRSPRRADSAGRADTREEAARMAPLDPSQPVYPGPAFRASLYIRVTRCVSFPAVLGRSRLLVTSHLSTFAAAAAASMPPSRHMIVTRCGPAAAPRRRARTQPGPPPPPPQRQQRPS